MSYVFALIQVQRRSHSNSPQRTTKQEQLSTRSNSSNDILGDPTDSGQLPPGPHLHPTAQSAAAAAQYPGQGERARSNLGKNPRQGAPKSQLDPTAPKGKLPKQSKRTPGKPRASLGFVFDFGPDGVVKKKVKAPDGQGVEECGFAMRHGREVRRQKGRQPDYHFTIMPNGAVQRRARIPAIKLDSPPEEQTFQWEEGRSLEMDLSPPSSTHLALSPLTPSADHNVFHYSPSSPTGSGLLTDPLAPHTLLYRPSPSRSSSVPNLSQDPPSPVPGCWVSRSAHVSPCGSRRSRAGSSNGGSAGSPDFLSPDHLSPHWSSDSSLTSHEDNGRSLRYSPTLRLEIEPESGYLDSLGVRSPSLEGRAPDRRHSQPEGGLRSMLAANQMHPLMPVRITIFRSHSSPHSTSPSSPLPSLQPSTRHAFQPLLSKHAHAQPWANHSPPLPQQHGPLSHHPKIRLQHPVPNTHH